MLLRDYIEKKIAALRKTRAFFDDLKKKTNSIPVASRNSTYSVSNDILQIESSGEEFTRQLTEFCLVYNFTNDDILKLSNNEINYILVQLDADRLNIERIQFYFEQKIKIREDRPTFPQTPKITLN